MEDHVTKAYARRHPVERLKLRLRVILMLAGTLAVGFGLVRLWQLGVWP